ncbi:MAG: hypothetical protein JWQ88_1265, partial [Rhodoferax sp.]|nr:hypothetical protein [Rhodoferax sp.]
CLQDLGISLIQGYFFSKPLFENCLRTGDPRWLAAPDRRLTVC